MYRKPSFKRDQTAILRYLIENHLGPVICGSTVPDFGKRTLYERWLYARTAMTVRMVERAWLYNRGIDHFHLKSPNARVAAAREWRREAKWDPLFSPVHWGYLWSGSCMHSSGPFSLRGSLLYSTRLPIFYESRGDW